MELSGTLGSSKRRWSNIHNDIKSTNVDWLMVFGMEGKSEGVLVPVRMELSGPPTGVAAGFSCPADPLTPAAGRGAGPSKSSGSSKRNWELCDDSTTETSAGLSKSLSTTVVGPSTVTGPSPVAEPSPVVEPSPVAGPLPVAEPSPVAGPLPVAEPWPVVGSLPVTVPLRAAVTSLVAEPPLAVGPAPAEPSAAGAGTGTAGAGTGTAGADSIWICRAGEATTVIVRFPGALGFAGDSLTSRLATNVPPVLSELSPRLSRWLGRDLRSGDARDEDDERDRRSPEEWCWWWREEELDGRVSDAFETLPDSARLGELDPPEELGRARSLSLRSLLGPSRRDDWCLGDSWRLSSLCLRLRSGVLDLRWSDPWELGRSTAVTLEATDLGCDELVTVLDHLALDLVSLVGKASLGACNSTESSIISVSFLAAFAAAAALRRFLCAIALACAVQASGSQSWHTRQGLSWVQRGKSSFKRHCWQRRWLSFLRRKWEHSGNFSCVGNGSTQETLAAIRLTTTCHVTSPPLSRSHAKT